MLTNQDLLLINIILVEEGSNEIEQGTTKIMKKCIKILKCN